VGQCHCFGDTRRLILFLGIENNRHKIINIFTTFKSPDYAENNFLMLHMPVLTNVVLVCFSSSVYFVLLAN